ncbi:tape measure protein [Leuconostoc gelidum]|uniref:tape measure protein n=1 Tax=Leuconostoc gelidum TaxID=1244 RepID=UPI001CC66C63|nr:tape measure protein [Leuconostoc gelidum]
MADGSINIDLLLNDQTDKTWTEFKGKAEREGKSGYEKFKDAFKGNPLAVKLETQANKAGITNFRELLNKLPKEKQTELLAKAKKGEVIDYEKLLREIPSKITSEVKLNDNASTGLRSLKNQAHDVGDKFKRLKDVMIGTFAAQALMGGIRAVVDGLKEASKAGMEYNKEQDTMRTVWSALTTEAPKDGKELLNYINSLSQHSIYAADDINKMAQSFYHVHSNVEETKKWTDSFVALGSTLHMTGPQISESGEMFAKIVAGGKASSEDMAVMINRFPMFGEALQKATGKSMKELYAMSAAGKLSAEQFTETLDYLGEKYKGGTSEAMTSMQGMSMYLKSRLSVLSGDVMKSSFNMSKSATEALQKIVSDDSMKVFADGIGKAFGGLLTIIGGFIQFIERNKNTIVAIFGGIEEVVTKTFGIIGDALSMFATSFKNNVLGVVANNGVGKNVDAIKKAFEGLVEAIKPVAQAIGGFVGVIAGGVVSTFVNIIKGIADGFTNAGNSADKSKKKFDFSGVFDVIVSISQELNILFGAITEIVKPLGEIIGSIASGIFETFVDVVFDIVGAFKAMVGETKGAKENINPVAKALESVAKHKKALEAIGIAIGSIATALIAVKGTIGVFKLVSSGITVVKDAFTSFRIAVMLLGDSWKALNTFMKANIFIIIITAVIAIGVAFYELYKHNKKFRDFINGLVSGAADFFKGVGKWFGEAGKAIGKFFGGLGKSADNGKKHISDFFGGLGKWFSNVGKSIGNGASVFGKWFDGLVKGFAKGWNSFVNAAVKLAKGFGKLLLYALAIPVGLAIIIVKPLIEPLKKIFNTLISWIKKAWNGTVKFLSKIWEPVKKAWDSSIKLIVKLWQGYTKIFNGVTQAIHDFTIKVWSATWNVVKKVFTTVWNFLVKLLETEFNFYKKIFTITLNFISKIWTSAWRGISDVFEKIWNGIKKFFKPIIDWLGDIISDTLNWIKKIWQRAWNAVTDTFTDAWHNIKKSGSKGINALKSTLDGVLDKIGKSFSDTWNGIKDGFGSMWDGMKSLAGKGINAVIKIPNAGVDGINGLIHDFGGPKNALGKIPKVAFASGTGAFSNVRRAITSPTMAVLNDGFDSPETGNKEALIHPNGAMEVVQGRNTERLLMPGTEVLNASELSMIMGQQHFAGGTGFLGSIWDGAKSAGSWVGKTAGNAWDGIKNASDKFTKMFSFITGAIAHPVKTLENVFNPKAGGNGNVMDGLSGGAFKHVKNQAVDWWQSLWGMANDEASGGSNSELLKEVIKLGTGKPYVWGAAGPDSFDCSGLVEYALSQMGKGFPKYSGAQFNASDAVSDPKSGDLAFFGSGGSEHVGVYGGNGKMFSAMSPSSNPNIGWANVSDWSEKLEGYHRVPGLKSEDTKQSSNPMASLIRSQVGGMFDWIKKFIAPTRDSHGEPAGDGVSRWSGDVKSALSKLGLSTSGSMVNKVLKQIQTESGGNAGAMGGNDGLADGNATGLMQVKPGTFRAFALAGHNNIMNGYDNILAGLNYAKSRYGTDLSFLGQGHGYANGTGYLSSLIKNVKQFANGGWADKPSIFGEIPGQPEIAINPARATADEHINEAIVARAKKAPNSLSAKMASIVQGAKSGMQAAMSPQPSFSGNAGAFGNGGSVDLSGDVHMVIQMDSGEVARATYPKIKIMQNQEIQLKGQRTGNTYGY